MCASCFLSSRLAFYLWFRVHGRQPSPHVTDQYSTAISWVCKVSSSRHHFLCKKCSISVVRKRREEEMETKNISGRGRWHETWSLERVPKNVKTGRKGQRKSSCWWEEFIRRMYGGWKDDMTWGNLSSLEFMWWWRRWFLFLLLLCRPFPWVLSMSSFHPLRFPAVSSSCVSVLFSSFFAPQALGLMSRYTSIQCVSIRVDLCIPLLLLLFSNWLSLLSVTHGSRETNH